MNSVSIHFIISCKLFLSLLTYNTYQQVMCRPPDKHIDCVNTSSNSNNKNRQHTNSAACHEKPFSFLLSLFMLSLPSFVIFACALQVSSCLLSHGLVYLNTRSFNCFIIFCLSNTFFFFYNHIPFMLLLS